MTRAALVLIVVLFAAGPAIGKRPSGQELAGLQSEYRDELTRARRLRADAIDAAAEVAALEDRLRTVQAAVVTGDVEIEAQRRRLRELGAQEASLTTELARTRSGQGRLLTALMMMGRRPPPPLLIPASRATDTVRAAILMKAMAPDLERRARAVADRQIEVARVRRLAVLSSERLFTSESEQGDRRAEMESLVARKTALNLVLKAEAAAAERAAAALEGRIRALGGTVPQVEADLLRVTARSPGGRDRLSAPVAAPPQQRFDRNSPGWRWRAEGRSAVAPAAGTIAYAGPLRGWGQVVIIDLGPGWRAVIAGLESLDIASGSRVAEGQTLGRGAPDGEIYFELRRDERPVDPAPWLQ